MASFDADEGPAELRLRGNLAYKAHDFEDAIELYSQAIALHAHGTSPSVPATASASGTASYPADTYLAIGNRAACHLALSQWGSAAADARLAWEHSPGNDKYCFRLVSALRALGDGGDVTARTDAEAVLAAGLLKTPASAALLKLQQQQGAEGAASGKGSKRGTKRSQKGGISPIDRFYAAAAGGEDAFCGPCNPPPSDGAQREMGAQTKGALLVETAAQASYSDEEYLMLLHAKAFVERIQQGQLKGATQEHILSGRLAQLCMGGQESFFELLFPGSSLETRKTVPQNLRELLLWPELVLDLTAVAKAAAKVLAGVRARGAQGGDVMDAATRDMLAPQIAQEALAREILSAVKKVSKDYSRVAAAVQLSVASHTAPQALLDQLDMDVIVSLKGVGLGCQEEYLGPQWAALVGADLQNFAKFEHMSDIVEPGGAAGPGGSSGSNAADAVAVPVRLAWLERGYEQYPALTEAMSKLLSLPYEINKKVHEAGSGSGSDSPRAQPRLLEPASKIALMHFRPLSRQSRRVDCKPGPADSGIRLTCSYHLVPARVEGVGSVQWVRAAAEKEAGTEAEERRETEKEPQREGREEILDDLLVLHHSTQVHTARPAAASEYFVLCFYVHGKD